MTSLSTSVAVDLVLDVIANKLFSDDVAPELALLHFDKPITKNNSRKLLKLITACIFTHNRKFFLHIDNVASANP